MDRSTVADGNDRGQTGLDRLLAFVAVAVVLVAVAPTALGLVGVDVRADGEAAGGDGARSSTAPAALQILDVRGTAAADGRTVGAVEVTVTKIGSGDPVDLSGTMVTWIGNQSRYLVPVGRQTDGTDGEFSIDVLDADDRTEADLESGERATLTFDVGGDDVDGVAEFGQPLEEGDTVELVLATERGRTVATTIRVPEVTGREPVDLGG